MSVFKKIYKKLLLCFSVFLFISSAQAATFTKTPLKAGFIKIKQGNKYLTINQGGATNAHKITLETLKNDSTQIFAVISYGNIRAILGTLNNDYSYDINTGLKNPEKQGLLSVYGFYYAYSYSLAAHRIIETYRIGDESNTTYLITNPTEAANDNFYGITNYQWCRDADNEIEYQPKEYVVGPQFEIEYVSALANAIPVTSNSGAVKFTDGDIVSIKSLLNNLFVSCKKQEEPGYQPWIDSNTSPKAVAYDSRLNPESLFKVRKAGNDIGFEPYELDSNNSPLGTTRGYLCFNKDITFNVGNSIGNWKEYYKLNIQNVSGNTYIFNVKGYINRLDFFVGIVPDDVALRVGYSNKKDTNGNYTRNMLWEIKKLTPERVTELTTYAIESYAPKVEIEEVQLAAGDLRIKDKNDNYITIKKAGENDYSFGLAMEASLSSANLLFGIRDGNNFKIFGTLNTDRDFYSDMPNIKYTKTVTETGEILGDLVNMHIKQGFLSSYRNGSFQTSWYNSFYGVAIKIYKVVGTQNANTKYLITNATGYAYNSFFGVDTTGDFTFELCQNDQNAQFEIEGTGVPSDVTIQSDPTEIATGFITIQKDNKYVTITNTGATNEPYKISLNDSLSNPGTFRLIGYQEKQKILGTLNNNYSYDINNTDPLNNQGFLSDNGFNRINPQKWIAADTTPYFNDTIKFYKVTNAGIAANTYLISSHAYDGNNNSIYGTFFYKIDNSGTISRTSEKNDATQFVITILASAPAGATTTPLILEAGDEAEEEMLNQGIIKIKKDNKYISIKDGGNAYSFDLSIEEGSTANEPRQKLFVKHGSGKQKIFASLNPNDYEFHPDVANSKNINQGFLSAYRDGCFQTSYYKYFSSGPIKTFKINGTTNKYLITSISAYNNNNDNCFFGADSSGFLISLNKNDIRAQFEIERITTVETKTPEELEKEQIQQQIQTLQQLLQQKQTALTSLTGFAKIIAQAEITGINAQISALQQILSPPATPPSATTPTPTATPPPATTALPARAQRRSVSPFGGTRRSTTGQIRRPTRPTYGRPTYSRVIQRRPTSR